MPHHERLGQEDVPLLAHAPLGFGDVAVGRGKFRIGIAPRRMGASSTTDMPHLGNTG
jgi:hypothetical protein